MTSLVPVSRAVPTERTPLTLLPPSQPRPVNENEISPKETMAVVDMSKSYASLFGSKNSATQQQQQPQSQGQGQGLGLGQGQNENMNDNHDNDSSDRNDNFKHNDHDRNNDKSYQNNTNQNNNDRNFPSMSNQRDRDSNVRNDNNQRNNNSSNNSNTDHNNDSELPSNSIARKRQLFDPKSNKMVDPELHPDNLPTQAENKNNSDKNKKGGDLVPQGGPDATKRPRPLHPRSDEVDGQWKRGVRKAEGENGVKINHSNNNTNANANANFIPPSDLAGGNDEDEVCQF